MLTEKKNPDTTVSSIDLFLSFQFQIILNCISISIIRKKNEELTSVDVNEILRKSLSIIENKSIKKHFLGFFDKNNKDLFYLLNVIEFLTLKISELSKDKDMFYNNQRIFDNVFDENIINQVLVRENDYSYFTEVGKVYLQLIIENNNISMDNSISKSLKDHNISKDELYQMGQDYINENKYLDDCISRL